MFLKRCLLSLLVFFEVNLAKIDSYPKAAIYNHTAAFDGNRIRCWLSNEGEVVSYRVTNKAGLYWPKNSQETVVFQAGPRLVGKVQGEIRSAAVEYTTEFIPGKVAYDPQSPSLGIPDNPTKPEYRIYKVNRNDSPDPAAPNYNLDYAFWPAGDGAPAHDGEYFTDLNQNGHWDSGEPFEDFNLNGNYDAADGQLVTGQDPPRFIGDQQLWYIMNDFSVEKHAQLYSTAPLGVEVQVLQYGFDVPQLADVLFVRWLIINKSGRAITETYFGFWADHDIGDAIDDLAGCDTTLDLSYGYNGRPFDASYGLFPPAVGFALLQGPIVPDLNNCAFTTWGYLENYRNLPMTACLVGACGQWLCDPETASELLRSLQGLNVDGSPVVDENGNSTPFTFAGDPVTGEGWIASDTLHPGDFRLIAGSGPFDFPTWSDLNGDALPQAGEPGVQEIVGAIIVAPGSDNLQAINNLRALARLTRAFHHYGDQRPSLSLISPPSGATLTNPVTLTWTNDPTKPLAEIVVPEFSNDGISWLPIDTLTLNTGSYTWNLSPYPGGPVIYLRLLGFAQDPNQPVIPAIANGVIKLLNYNISEPAGPFLIDNPGINDPPYISPLIQTYTYTLNVTGDYPLTWQIIDPEKQNIVVGLELKNRYCDWQAVVLNLPERGEWVLPSAKLPNSTQTFLRLKVSDGTNQVYREFPHQFILTNERRKLIPVVHSAGKANEPIIRVAVLNPDEMNQHQYTITFASDSQKTFAIFDKKLQNFVLKDLPILTAADESPVFDGLAVTVQDIDHIIFVPEKSGWIAGNCNWAFTFTSHLGRVYPAEYEIRFTSNGSLDINGKQAPFEVWNVTENRQPKYVLAMATSTRYNLGIYEIFQDNEQLVWAVNLTAPSENPVDPQPGDIVNFYVTIPLSPNDVYEFTNEYVGTIADKPLPQQFSLLPLYPNPFNPQTNICYQLPQAAQVTIKVFNLVGQLVKILLDENKPAGQYTLSWNATDLASGIYFVSLQAGNYHQVQKCLLLK